MTTSVIPDTTTKYEGARTTVTVALLVVAECPHGHGKSWSVADVEHVDYFSSKAAEWADEHGSTCTGPTTGKE